MTSWLLVASAAAFMAPRDYRDELHEAAAETVASLHDAGRSEEALAFAADFQKHIEPAAKVQYERGLVLRLQGSLDAAFKAYTRAIELDPGDPAAYYDRGEIALLEGDIAQATRDFAKAAELAPDQWVVHFRLADLAARAGDPVAFEEHVMNALRNGFDFRTIADDPVWRGYARDPALGLVLNKLITVYSDEAIFDSLLAPR